MLHRRSFRASGAATLLFRCPPAQRATLSLVPAPACRRPAAITRAYPTSSCSSGLRRAWLCERCFMTSRSDRHKGTYMNTSRTSLWPTRCSSRAAATWRSCRSLPLLSTLRPLSQSPVARAVCSTAPTLHQAPPTDALAGTRGVNPVCTRAGRAR